jgi:hypothetical protein
MDQMQNRPRMNTDLHGWGSGKADAEHYAAAFHILPPGSLSDPSYPRFISGAESPI